MKAKEIKKILIFDQGNPVANQLLGKAVSLFGTGIEAPEYVFVKVHKAHNLATLAMEKAIREEKPQLVLIGATALGEEVAPALGVRLGTGVAAHCIDIGINKDGRMAFMVPAFGGKVIGEIFIPGANTSDGATPADGSTKAETPAIATVKPGVFNDFDGTVKGLQIIDIDSEIEAGDIPECEKAQGTFKLVKMEQREHASEDISKAKLILCGGFGLGKKENQNKLLTLANKLGGAIGCTRSALDAEWGFAESTMIGTSGITVRPKVYVGFGISGATHHVCGIKDADIIISINKDKNAEVFETSDYKGIFDAEQTLDALLEEIER